MIGEGSVIGKAEHTQAPGDGGADIILLSALSVQAAQTEEILGDNYGVAIVPSIHGNVLLLDAS